MTLTNDKIDEVLADIMSYICKNPLIFVSETDIHSLVEGELMKIPELRELYPTNCTIGRNKHQEASKNRYKTTLIHKEYGHPKSSKSVPPASRSDLVILSKEDVKLIDDPMNLKHNKEWLTPDYIFEFGTEKAAGSERIFKKHLNSDIKKIEKSRKKGYVIHIQRNLCRSKGAGLIKNRSKYEGYSKIIKESIKGIDPKLKVLVIIIDIGNERRGVYNKIKIFKDGAFRGISQDQVKEEIKRII